MKENTENITQHIFTHFPPINTNHCQAWFAFTGIKRRVRLLKEHIQNGLIALGIGSIFLFSMYLFLTQLAEYGWR